MIEYDNPNFNANLSALVQGMWYSELPELIDLDRIYNNFESVLRSMESGKYPYYPLDEDGFIKDYKAVTSPGYLRNHQSLILSLHCHFLNMGNVCIFHSSKPAYQKDALSFLFPPYCH